MSGEKRESIGDIKEETFSARSRRQSDSIVVSMRGNADSIVCERLKTLLDELHVVARHSHVKVLVFEVQELYFMNSSCLSLFLRLINHVLELSDAEKYLVRFRSNSNLRWQKKSLQAIASYAKDIVAIE